MPESMPGLVITAKVRWESQPENVGAQLFFFAPTVAAHSLPCILEEIVEEGTEEKKNDQVVKLRILMAQQVADKTAFKLQLSPVHVLAEGIIQEVT